MKKRSGKDEWGELARAAQAGDKKAYNRLLSEIFPYVRNIIIGRLSNTEAADDIAQDVLLSIHKSLHTYDPVRPFMPWLMAIVSFRRADYLRSHYARRQNVQTGLDDPIFEKTHVTESPYAGELKDIEAALSDLPEKQRRLFELVRVEGYSMEEAAGIMRMGVSAVKVSVHRTLKKLQSRVTTR
ncbi:MAG: sigma-70 family RNA polymerase sigma factor [Alphaproteobacteria bacterium]|nr:sigma-70 family RNA polymerase sigma factor [Alphaproteobacteria bacterium]